MAIISRRQYDHPALATAGGSALHASITNLYTVLGDDSMSRYKTFTAVANSSVGVIAHEFGLDFANLKVQIFTGTYPALTLVSDPVGSGWTVAATSGLASRSIDVTAPASGGPHTYAVVVTHESSGSQYIPGLVSIGTQSFAGAKTFLTSTSTPISAVTNYSLYSEVSAPATPLSGVAIYAKTDKKMYRKGTDGVEAEIGSGSASGFINYILNADLEAGNTTGWATYKDAAASTPVDGTGGSPTTLTVTANGTTPLRGNFDLKIAKTGVNSQGEGFSYDFTIKSPDISKKLQVSFDLNTNDANYSSGDVVIYIYDVTNSTLITPSVTAIPKIGASTYSLTFDTTTSLSYRLIFHWATVNATASNIYFENFFVGPGSLVQGAAVGIFRTYTPVAGTDILGSASNPTFGTVLSNQVTIWRNGSNATIRWDYYHSVAGSLGSGRYQFKMPSDLTIDMTLITAQSPSLGIGNGAVGTFTATDNTNEAIYSAQVASSTIIEFRGGAGIGSWASTDVITFADTLLRLSFIVTVPIAQWAGNGTANLGINPIQYLGNSNTSTSVNDTSAFTFGPAGNSIVAVSSTGVWVKKRVQLLQGNWSASGGTPIVKVSADGLLWLNAQDVFPPLKSAGLFYGIDIQVSGVNTVDVAFGGDGASTGAAWSTVTSYKWRVDVAVPGQAVGFGIASTTASGLIPSGVYNNTTQAWTLGGSGSTQTQIIYGNVLDVVSAAGASGVIKLSRGTSGTTYGRIGHAVSANNLISGGTTNDMCIIANSGIAFTADDGTTQHGRLSTAGAWTLGAVGSLTLAGTTKATTNPMLNLAQPQGNSIWFGHSNTNYNGILGGYSGDGDAFIGGYFYHSSTANVLKYSSSSTVPTMLRFLGAGGASFFTGPGGTLDNTWTPTNVGGFTSAGAWTLGGTGLTASHIIKSGAATNSPTLDIISLVTGANPSIRLNPNVVGDWGEFLYGGTAGYRFKNSSNTVIGELTHAGACTFGPNTSTGAALKVMTTTQNNRVCVFGRDNSATVISVAASGTATFRVADESNHAGLVLIMDSTSAEAAICLVGFGAFVSIISQTGSKFVTGAPTASQIRVQYANTNSEITITNGSSLTATYKITVMGVGI